MRYPISKKLMVGSIVALVVVCGSMVYSHCQIPCGIYGDSTRFSILSEHITTIEKSMNQINELSAAKPSNMNQLVRWVQNKEEHADEINHIVTFYFMAQRVKPALPGSADYAGYVKKITLLHQMMVYAMKARQTTDLDNVAKLREVLEQFHTAYEDH